MDSTAKLEEVYSFPLSFAQQRLWFLDQISPGNPFYNITTAIPLLLPLDVALLERSINAIIERHEALRTNFIAEQGTPIQLVKPERKIVLETLDFQHISEAERDLSILQEYTRSATYSFDLASDSLIRASVLQFGPDDFVLILVMHHIVSDGWSLKVFWGELIQIYNAFSVGKPNPLPEIIIQYGDFAIWQREWLTENLLEKQLNYWRKRLEGIQPLELKTDRRRPSVLSYNGSVEQIRLTGNLTRALKNLSQKRGTTLFMTMLSAFVVLLHRYTQQNCIVLGTPIAGRNRLELEGLIGFFVNTLVLKFDFHPSMNFLQVMELSKEIVLGAFTHQELPFEKLVEELQIERDLSRNPLFQVTFQLLSAPNSQKNNNEEDLKLERGAAIFDLALNLIDSGEEISGNLEYSSDLFERETISRMVANYKSLLVEIITHPEKKLADYVVLSKPEYQETVVNWNENALPPSDVVFVHKAFGMHAAADPGAPAVVAGKEVISYEQIEQRANQLANALIREGVVPESLVGVCLDRSPEMIIAFLGILKAGAAYVPLDPAFPAERLENILRENGIPMLITQDHYQQKLHFDGIRVLTIDSTASGYCDDSIDDPAIPLRKENRAYVIFTSGSSGRPKGVEITHRGLSNLVRWHWETYQIGKDSKATQTANIAFDACVWEIWPYLSAGACLFIVEDERRLSPQGLLELWKDRQIDFAFLPTPLAEAVLAEPWLEETDLKVLLTGGDVLRKFPPPFTRFKFINHYGPTENTVVATFGEVKPDADPEVLPSIGKPISGVQAYVLDAALRPLPIGAVGELFIGGESLARSYLNRPKLTAWHFIPNPFGPAGSRLYRTGDKVRYLSDGNLEFLGRGDDQVKIRGFRIELSEIEICLQQFPSVKEAVVLINKEDADFQQLYACLTMEKGIVLDREELLHFLKKQLPDYMIPGQFVVMDGFPLTPNGKIDKKAIYESGILLDISTKEIEQPQTSLEKVIEAIWCEILGKDQVGIHHNFFTELGGHSLLATQIVSRLRNALKVEIPLQTIFAAPTVSEFANAIAKDKPTQVRLEKIASILIDLENLSEEELKGRLGKSSTDPT